MFDPDRDGVLGLPVHAFYAQIGVDEGANRATFASLMAWGDQPSDAANRGEAHIHEWLHGAGGYYRERGFAVPDPRTKTPATASSGRTRAAAGEAGTPPSCAATSSIPTPAQSPASPPTSSAPPSWPTPTGSTSNGIRCRAPTTTRSSPSPRAGSFASKVDAGAADRGPFLYTYFHRSELCDGAGTPAGEHAIWVQIWAGDDPNRAVTADAGGTIVGP